MGLPEGMWKLHSDGDTVESPHSYASTFPCPQGVPRLCHRLRLLDLSLPAGLRWRQAGH